MASNVRDCLVNFFCNVQPKETCSFKLKKNFNSNAKEFEAANVWSTVNAFENPKKLIDWSQVFFSIPGSRCPSINLEKKEPWIKTEIGKKYEIFELESNHLSLKYLCFLYFLCLFSFVYLQCLTCFKKIIIWPRMLLRLFHFISNSWSFKEFFKISITMVSATMNAARQLFKGRCNHLALLSAGHDDKRCWSTLDFSINFFENCLISVLFLAVKLLKKNIFYAHILNIDFFLIFYAFNS